MLYFKPRKRDYKRATDIKQEKRLAKLKGKEPEKKISIPRTQVSFPKVAYIINSKDMTNVPT